MGALLALSLLPVSCGDGADTAPGDEGEGPPTADEIRANSGAPQGSQSGATGSDPVETPRATETSDTRDRSATGETDADEGGQGGTAAPSADPAEAIRLPGGPPYAVQLGAFQREGNARALEESLQEAGLPVWTGTTRAGEDDLLRIRVGVTPTVADARRLIREIRGRLSDEPDSAWIAPLGREDAAPAGMMETTSTLLAND